ncbi:MAG TPA: rhomboid family intramembrane serine protease [Candidatus Limnocylindrales bacterium]|nr:rhomboid family intramembrane serine protease [Candidatus Limnocylindrales bacterium]
MDESSEAVPESATPGPRLLDDPDTVSGPLDRELALAFLARGDDLLDGNEPAEAGRYYRRVVGFGEVEVTAAALLGLGQALGRLGRPDQAVATWMSITELPRTDATYLAWREIAAAHVREGDLERALAAYRQAERLAPTDERAEIAARLGWLAKETGDPRGAKRWFRIARGGGAALPMTWLIMGVTLVVSIAAYASIDTDLDLYVLLALDKAAVAAGEVWRLWTTTLVHAPPTGGLGILHLGFNMYALYVVGPIVERYYGAWLMLLFYLVFAAAGSISSFVFADNRFSVGASGAIFGLIGLVFVAGRVHHWAFDRRTRAFAGSLGIMVIFNLAIGFANPLIDNAAHLGGLAAGAWLGFLVPPRNMPAGSERDDLERGRRARLRQAIGVVALIGVLVAGLLVGRELWLA